MANVTLGSVLVAGEALPRAIEAKWPKLPKVSTVLDKIATKIPAGPKLFPAPPVTGFPVPTAAINKLPLDDTFKRAPIPINPLPERTMNPNINFMARNTQGQIGGTAIDFK